MNTEHAKRILLSYRPNHPDRTDPMVAQAIGLMHQDPNLKEWFGRHQVFQQTVQRSLREVPVPPGLARRILLQRRIVRPRAWWANPRWLAAAAAVVLLLGLGALLWWPPSEDNFSTFRSRMVRNVLRQYAMDIVTNDMSAIRSFLSTRQAPADYTLPSSLDELPVTGAGILSFEDQRVSMVCLNSADQGTLWLFVVAQKAIRPSPPAWPATPQFLQVSKLMTASWSNGGKAYVLATIGSRESLRRRF